MQYGKTLFTIHLKSKQLLSQVANKIRYLNNEAFPFLEEFHYNVTYVP